MDKKYVNQLIHSTVRIEAQTSSGTKTGTGFIYLFGHVDDKTPSVPAVITNKHVVEHAETVTFHVTPKGKDGLPIFGAHVRVGIRDVQKGLVPHPDPHVDLVAFTYGSVLRVFAEKGREAYYRGLAEEYLPTAEFVGGVSAVHDVLMIGYPNSLWDSTNNIPIARRGVTATPLYLDYEGRGEFLIDAACYPGSSGSPIFAFSKDESSGKTKMAIVGILYAGPQHVATGGIKFVPIGETVRPIAEIGIPNNLGLCIKAYRIKELEPLVLAQIRRDT